MLSDDSGFCFLTYGWCAIKGKPFHLRPRKGVVEETGVIIIDVASRVAYDKATKHQ